MMKLKTVAQTGHGELTCTIVNNNNNNNNIHNINIKNVSNNNNNDVHNSVRKTDDNDSVNAITSNSPDKFNDKI